MMTPRTMIEQLRNHQKVLVVVGGLLIVGLLVWVGSQKRLRDSADVSAVWNQSLDQLRSADAWHASVELALDLGDAISQERVIRDVVFAVEGDVRRAADETPELAGTFKIEGKGRGNIFFADGDVQLLHDRILFYLDNVPQLLNPSGSLAERWTLVESSILRTRNTAAIREALLLIAPAFSYEGTEEISGSTALRFTGDLTADQEEQLYEMLRQRSSGSPAWQVVARLLQANDISAVTFWIDEDTREFRQAKVSFERVLDEEEARHFATLTVLFTDYNVPVSFTEVEPSARVNPSIFSRLFGSGDLTSVDE